MAGTGPVRSKTTRDKMKKAGRGRSSGGLTGGPPAFILSETGAVGVGRLPTAKAELGGCISDSGT